MVRKRWVDRATRGTSSGRGGDEIPRTVLRPERPEITPEPDLEIQVIPEDPEEIKVREGIYERIQAEIHHEDKEAETTAKEMLEVPPEWNEIPDLMMEGEDVWPANEAVVKPKIDEVAWGQRKRRKEDICPESTHSVTENTESRGILFWRLEWSSTEKR